MAKLSVLVLVILAAQSATVSPLYFSEPKIASQTDLSTPET